MLSVFQFDKAKTPEGKDIEVDGGFSDSLVMYVLLPYLIARGSLHSFTP